MAYLQSLPSYARQLKRSASFFIMAHNDNDQYAEFFDAGHSGKEHTVHQRMRANSTIMELKKILGEFTAPESRVGVPLNSSLAYMG